MELEKHKIILVRKVDISLWKNTCIL